MKIIKKSLIILLPAAMFAATQDSPVISVTAPAVIKTTYTAPTGTEQPTDWKTNHYDMKTYLEKLNGGTESSGKGSQLMRDLGVGEDVLKNPQRSTVTTSALKANANYKSINSVSSFDKYNQQITSAAAGNSTLSLNEESGQIKCYITRDIGFAYKCSKAGGLTYGGQINDDGTSAKNQCMSDCYEGFECVSVQNSTKMATTSELITTPNTINFTSTSLSRTLDFTTSDSSRKTSAIIISGKRLTSSTDLSKYNFYADVFYKTTGSSTFVPLIKRAYFDKTHTSLTLSIYENVSNIRIVVYTDVTNLSSVEINSLKTIHNDESAWICKSQQDITDLSPSAYSYVCPKGTVNSLALMNGNIVKVCKNANSGGDNPDGSYSSKEGCSSVCRKAYPCVPSFGTFTADSLKSFREGCVGSSSNCSDNPSGAGDASDLGDCKVARLNGSQIISENVFDAYMNRTQTVSSGAVIPGVDRPRIMDSDDTNATRKNTEEWKDEAYLNMQKEGTYSATKVTLGEDTEQSSAYGIGMSSGVDAGTLDPTQRTLYWKLKTKSSDALTNKNLFFYSVIEADIEYYGYDINGKKVGKRDRIWYIKTAESDTFKPIRRAVEYGVVNLNELGLPTVIKNSYSTPQYQTFTGSSWATISPSQSAEAFKTGKITVLSPYEMIPIVNNMSIFYESLPGIIRRIDKDGPIETAYYSGTWGSGRQALATYSVFNWYSTASKTYSQLMNDIDNALVSPIYNSSNVPHFAKEVQHDAVKDTTKDIEIYKFGTVDKLSAYMRIKPKSTDIGKTGFVFVFVY